MRSPVKSRRLSRGVPSVRRLRIFHGDQPAAQPKKTRITVMSINDLSLQSSVIATGAGLLPHSGCATCKERSAIKEPTLHRNGNGVGSVVRSQLGKDTLEMALHRGF